MREFGQEARDGFSLELNFAWSLRHERGKMINKQLDIQGWSFEV